jgi:hypothetical protein
MRITSFLLDLGGGIFVLFGLLHAIYTFLDIRRPRRLVPDDPAVSDAMARSRVRLARGGTTMWRAWVGFNFSHSLGAVLFGALCIFAAAVIGTVVVPGWVLFLLSAIGLTYLVIGVLYWFRIPIAGIAVATGCLLVAWLNYVASSSH